MKKIVESLKRLYEQGRITGAQLTERVEKAQLRLRNIIILSVMKKNKGRKAPYPLLSIF